MLELVVAEFVVEDGKRSDAALKATAAGAAAAGRRVGLGAAGARRRRRVRSSVMRSSVRRLVQLLLHHRHRDLAHLEEVAD